MLSPKNHTVLAVGDSLRGTFITFIDKDFMTSDLVL